MRQTAYHYRAFGLVIASQQRITSLSEISAGSPDVEIALVASNHHFEDARLRVRFANWHAGPDCLLLRVDGVAEYCIRDGKRIDVKPTDGASDEAVSTFLMSSAFATLLQQRRLLTIHASGVMGAKGAILFVGRSGIGKSTTMAAMQDRGFAMMADDVGAIEFSDEGVPGVRASFSGSRLTAHSLAKLGKPVDAYRKLNSEIEKFAFPVELGQVEPSRIERIIVLDVSDKPEVTFDEVSPAEAFQLLSLYTFRKRFYDGMGLQHFHFEAVSKLVAAVPVTRALRPERPFMLDELIDQIVDRANHPADDKALT